MAAIVLPVSIVGLIFGGCCSNVRRRRTTSKRELELIESQVFALEGIIRFVATLPPLH
jgi:hypothetical protein